MVAYRSNFSRVYGYFAYHVPADVAEELTAATFERVVRFWPSFDAARGHTRAWVLAIARNVLADHFTQLKAKGTVPLGEEGERIELHAAGRDPLARRLSIDTVKQWLTLLNPRQREVVAMRYAADLTTREIATVLATSEANVHQILSRSLALLRREISAESPARRPEPDAAGLGARRSHGPSRLARPQRSVDVE